MVLQALHVTPRPDLLMVNLKITVIYFHRALQHHGKNAIIVPAKLITTKHGF
jgi:hypothetical protein